MPCIVNTRVKQNLHNFKSHKDISMRKSILICKYGSLKSCLTLAQNTSIVSLLHFLIIGVLLQLFKKMNSEYPLKIQAMTF